MEAITAIIDYGLDGTDPDISGTAYALFVMAKPLIDKNNTRYQNGTKSGKSKTKPEPNENQTGTKPEANDNVYVNDKDNVKDNVNDNVNDNGDVNVNADTFCPEAETAPAETAASFRLNDGTLYNVTENDVEKYQQLYPGIDCRQELRNIVGWCDANPSRRKTRSGAKRFLNNWLARAQNQARPAKSEKKSGSAYIDAIHNRMDVVDEWYAKYAGEEESG